MRDIGASAELNIVEATHIVEKFHQAVGLVIASQIASASVASFFCRLSRVEERRGGDFMRAPFPLPAHQ